MTVPEQEFLANLKQEIVAEVAELLSAKPDDRPLLSARDVAKRLGVDDRSARRYIETGLLPSVKIAGVRRVEPAELDKFVAQGRTES